VENTNPRLSKPSKVMTKNRRNMAPLPPDLKE